MILAIVVAGGITHVLIQFIFLIIILAVIAGLIWCIERWIHPIPDPAKLVIALVLVLLVIIWAIQIFAPGSL